MPIHTPDIIFAIMSTRTEIEDAADSLSSENKEALLCFLAMRQRKELSSPEPRIYADNEMAAILPKTKPMERGSGKKLRIFLD